MSFTFNLFGQWVFFSTNLPTKTKEVSYMNKRHNAGRARNRLCISFMYGSGN